jgi:hypothetical protein
MKIRRPHTLVALLSLAACGDPSGVGVVVAAVEITPTTPSTNVGLFVQFQARALDASGQQLTGLDVSWSSSNSSIASIDDDGLATALGVGTTAITATIGGVPDSEVLSVDPSQCVGRVDVILNPGEHQAYDGDQCLLLPSGQAGDVYRVAIVRPTLIEDSLDTPIVALHLDPILSAAAAPEAVSPNAAPATFGAAVDPLGGLPRIDGSRFVDDAVARNATRRFHHELRERERDLGLHLRDALPDRPLLAPAALVDPPSRDDMYLDLECAVTTLRPVILIDFDDNLAIYQDSVQWSSSPMSTSATSQMLSYYDDYVVDMIAQYWGVPSDIDNDGRVAVVTTPSLPENAAAAVFSGDLVSSAGCASSNEREVIYFGQEIIANLVATDPSYAALGVLAHEAKHVVSLYHGIRRNAFHPTWIEEGTAEISQVMSSRIAWAATGGPAVGVELTGNHIIDAVNANGGKRTPEMWGVVSEIADVILNMSTQPNSLVTNPDGANPAHSFYAAAWHWHRFIGDAFGDASTPFADAPLFKALTDSTGAAGAAGLAQQTGRNFNELFEDVTVAVSLHKAGPAPARDFSTWNLFSATAIFSGPPEVAPPANYPWPITADAESAEDGGSPAKGFSAGVYSCPPRIVGGQYVEPNPSDRCRMGASGMRIHEFVSPGTGQGAQILVTGAASGKIIVTRLN